MGDEDDVVVDVAEVPDPRGDREHGPGSARIENHHGFEENAWQCGNLGCPLCKAHVLDDLGKARCAFTDDEGRRCVHNAGHWTRDKTSAEGQVATWDHEVLPEDVPDPHEAEEVVADAES